MDELHKFRVFNKLKSVYRDSSNGSRKETSAEHSWACLMLADYLLSRSSYELDRLKVYELLMYHDVVEIIAGDTPIHPDMDPSTKHKQEKEFAAAVELKTLLPLGVGEKFFSLFCEFEAQETREARFAKLVDQFECQIHELDYKDDWKGWTEEFFVTRIKPYFEEFSELEGLFDDLLVYLRTHKYFDSV